MPIFQVVGTVRGFTFFLTFVKRCWINESHFSEKLRFNIRRKIKRISDFRSSFLFVKSSWLLTFNHFDLRDLKSFPFVIVKESPTFSQLVKAIIYGHTSPFSIYSSQSYRWNSSLVLKAGVLVFLIRFKVDMLVNHVLCSTYIYRRIFFGITWITWRITWITWRITWRRAGRRAGSWFGLF